VQPVDVATMPRVAAELQTQSGHVSIPDAQHAPGVTGRESAPAVAQAPTGPSAAGGSGIASTLPPAQVAAAATEISGVAGQTSAKMPNKKARAAAPAKDPAAEASRVRVASSRHAVKPPPQPPAHRIARNSVVPDINPDYDDLRDDDSLLARTIGVTDHVIAATHRAVSTIGVIPTWIGSIGNRLGG